jgi:membrane associated rhomboid family serine protease
MISSKCTCGISQRWPERRIGLELACGSCETKFKLVSAEPLGDGAGEADFDAALIVRDGPGRVGERFVLGGIADITVGKRDGNHILLLDQRVSRLHCTLRRIDFGPSRWQIIDKASTNGLFVNGTRVQEHELKQGDLITIGGFDLEFISDFKPVASVSEPAAPVASADGPLCPSCDRQLKRGAKICTDCGIYIKTGEALVTSKGFDEDDLAVNADTWIRIVSFIVPFGLFPVASEAFGTRKPYATWAIVILTVVVSTVYYFAERAYPDSTTLADMKLWAGDPGRAGERAAMLRQALDTAASKLQHRREGQGLPGLTPADQEHVDQAMATLLAASSRPPGEFHLYQLLTHALLHAGLLHLAGNLLFMLVFGLRVNELIGNVKMAIVYPLLAIAAGGTFYLMTMYGLPIPMIGASGAIMGLAGMYFVFFPVQRVHVAIWIRPVMFFLLLGPFALVLIRVMFLLRRCLYKVFTMRGFWLLVLWVGLNDVLPVAMGHQDQTAHWAHLGGFVFGVIFALALLLTHQVNGRGADLITVSLGKHAWKLIGKPSTWAEQKDAQVRAVSLSMPN